MNIIIMCLSKNILIKILFLLLILSCQQLGVMAQTGDNQLFLVTVQTRFNEKASFYFEGSDTAITFSEFKLTLSEESSIYMPKFEKGIKHYEIGRKITTAGFVLLPIGVFCDRVLWGNRNPFYGFDSEDKKPVYTGTIIGASIFFIGLVVRANGVSELNHLTKEYNDFRINLAPTYGLTELNDQSLGLSLTLSF